jgi:hypothetical protein
MTCITIDFPSATHNDAEGINDTDQIVGVVGFSGVPWLDGYARLGTSFRRVTFPLSQANAAWKVNNSGQIVGSYNIDDVTHGYLLTPGS